MKQAIKKSSIKITKTDCAKIPDNVGFPRGGGSSIEKNITIIQAQKKSGLKPFNIVNGKIVNL